MSQDVWNAGVEYQIATNTVVGVNFVHTDLNRTIEDVGSLVNGSEVYLYCNPGEGLAQTAITTGATPPFANAQGEAQLRRPRADDQPPLQQELVPGRELRPEPPLRQLRGHGQHRRGGRRAAASARSPSSRRGQTTRPGSNVTRAWDLDELMFDSHGNIGVDGQPGDRSAARLQAVRLVQLRLRHQRRRELLRRAAARRSARRSSPRFGVSLLVDGRGSLGRTDFLTNTDLFLSHDIKLGDRGRSVRLELNVLNVFNQKQARHVFDSVNRIGANGRSVNSSRIDTGGVDLTHGYDYDALLARPRTPRSRRARTRAASPIRAT